MLKLINSRLQLLWGVLVGAIALASLPPLPGTHSDIFNAYFDGHWVHFLAYTVASFLPLLVWRRGTALVLSVGLAVLGTGMEIIRAIAGAKPPDVQYIIINALGVAAGILLGLNILARRSRMSQADI